MTTVKHRAFLLFGAPGAGKGTQGRILGQIPGFFHLEAGHVFRSLDLRTGVGQAFIQYSSRGELVPNDITYALWKQQVEKMITLGRFKPEIDHLVLDGFPRNLEQAEMMEEIIRVMTVFHLVSADTNNLIDRIQRRALKENRLDDANEEVIKKRLEVYENETRPVLDFYGPERVVQINADQYPYQVLREILENMNTEDWNMVGEF